MNAFPKVALVVLVAWVALALVMIWTSRNFQCPPGANLHGLKQLGVAVELSTGPSDFLQMVGPRHGSAIGSSNRSWLGRQQYLDFVFIVLYGFLFWILGGVLISAGFGGARFLGLAVRAAIVLAAAFDVLEDIAILRALGDDAFALPIRTFGVPKWTFFFLALLLLSVLFFYLCFQSAAAGGLERTLSGVTGLFFAAGGLLGLAGLIPAHYKLIGWASTGFAIGALSLLILLIRLPKGS